MVSDGTAILVTACVFSSITSIFIIGLSAMLIHGLLTGNHGIQRFFKMTMILCGIANMLLCFLITSVYIFTLTNNTYEEWFNSLVAFLWIVNKTSLFYMFHGKLYFSFIGSAFTYKTIYYKSINIFFAVIVSVSVLYFYYFVFADTDNFQTRSYGFLLFLFIHSLLTIFVLIQFNQRLFKLSVLQQTADKIEIKKTAELGHTGKLETQSTDLSHSSIDTKTSFTQSDVFMELLIKNSLLWFIIIICNFINGTTWIVALSVSSNTLSVVLIGYMTTSIDAYLNTLCMLLSCPICTQHYGILCKCEGRKTNGCHYHFQSLCVHFANIFT
eukprot:299729_1